jgi:hypothetical protein
MLKNCKYDHTNEDIQNQTMETIISCQINGDHTFTFEEALVEEQEIFKN